jgi:flagellar assembly factor FliW
MNGTPIPEVSAMLGHANVNITLTVYTHFIPKMRTNSTEKFAASMIFNKKKPFGEGVIHDKTTYWEKAEHS